MKRKKSHSDPRDKTKSAISVLFCWPVGWLVGGLFTLVWFPFSKWTEAEKKYVLENSARKV